MHNYLHLCKSHDITRLYNTSQHTVIAVNLRIVLSNFGYRRAPAHLSNTTMAWSFRRSLRLLTRDVKVLYFIRYDSSNIQARLCITWEFRKIFETCLLLRKLFVVLSHHFIIPVSICPVKHNSRNLKRYQDEKVFYKNLEKTVGKVKRKIS